MAAAASPSAIVGVGSGRCLDVFGGSRAAGARLIIWDCKGSSNQSWTLTPAGELKVYDPLTCLAVAGQSPTAGATVQISPCNGAANQKWRLNADGTMDVKVPVRDVTASAATSILPAETGGAPSMHRAVIIKSDGNQNALIIPMTSIQYQ